MKQRRLYLESLGCSKNLVDSEAALGFLLKDGFVLQEEPEGADLLVINTCSFIEAAREQSVERILELARIKEEGGGRLVVMGCLGQRYAEELGREMPEIDLLAGVGQQAELAAAIADLFPEDRVAADRGASRRVEGLRADRPQASFAGFLDRPLLTPPHLAYVKVGEGCSRSCSFCAIPGIRGRFTSRSIVDIETELRSLVDRGVGEVNLISQDTAFYGRDTGGAGLLELCRKLSTINDLRWIRIFYLHPVLMDLAQLLELFALPRVVPYLDMPIQHAANPLLKRMHRGHDRAHLEALFGALRRERPDLTLRTTVLVGHPGEGEQEFIELQDFLEEYPFDKLGIFGYSLEDGTASARQDDGVAPELIAERMDRIQVAQMAHSEELNRAQVGRRVEAVVEALAGVGDGLPPERSLDPLASAPFDGARAALRSARDAYEVDGHIFLDESEGLALGQWVQVEVTDADVYDLKGRLIAAPGLP